MENCRLPGKPVSADKKMTRLHGIFNPLTGNPSRMGLFPAAGKCMYELPERKSGILVIFGFISPPQLHTLRKSPGQRFQFDFEESFFTEKESPPNLNLIKRNCMGK
jgi:hypothetical protein